jgi:hypothetical protein
LKSPLEEGENGPQWNFSGNVQLERSIDPFLLQQASKMLNSKDTSTGLELKIMYPRVEKDTISKYEIALKNARIANSLSENINSYNESSQANSGLTFSSTEVTIYGVNFPAPIG